ncbi:MULTISPECIES: DUF2170 family protein [Vibrio]|uniref:YjfI family protein n=1 Tax=Vibrio ostreae TaxID=2841925 RepID=A0A975YMM5_9VIBR|nr:MULTISPECIES: DUF2170 family protein [Vibrio]QXO16590.1 YjfI family protein [Vibrio ostreae]WGY46402.1 DUF2170 family protein [Vibrio sp. ABG19]
MAIHDIQTYLETADHDWHVSQQDGSLIITNSDDLTAILVLAEQQMLIESLLFPTSAIQDQAQFDDLLMYLQKHLPLTTVGKTRLQGETYYTAFGSLSTDSKLENIELEITMLFQNVNELLHFSSEHLTNQ